MTEYRRQIAGYDLPTLRRMVRDEMQRLGGAPQFAERHGCKLDALLRICAGAEDVPSKQMMQGIGHKLIQVGVPIRRRVASGPANGGADARKE